MTFRRELSIDGIGYATTVVESGAGRFYSFWYCKACDRPGTPNELAPTVDEAHAKAKADLQEHHEAVHLYAQQA